jgi:putative ABC transport system permease protein
LNDLAQDIRYALRMLAKHPGFTAIAVVTLALGIGANTAIFSLLNQILLRQLPVKNPQELTVLRAPGPRTGHVWDDGDESQSFSYPIYKNLRDTNSVFSGILARFPISAAIASHGQTERGSGELVSGNYFDVLGLEPALGRLFTPEEDRVPGAEPYVVLSHAYWTRRFGNDASVLNQTLLINNTELTVVGVAPAGFTGIQVGQSADFFVPLAMKLQMLPGGRPLEEWGDYYLALMARRKPGVSLKQAQAGINAVYRPLLEEQLKTITSWNQQKRQEFLAGTIILDPGNRGRTPLQRDSGSALVALFVMVALVLLIACTNIANLLLAKGAARQRELAIRAAMGASRSRMVRQLLAESLLCAFAGGAVGLLFGSWLMSVLTPAVASNMNVKGLSASLDAEVLIFALLATLTSGLVFGLIPAWRVTRTAVSQTLKDQSSTTSATLAHARAQKILVAGQIAFTMLLLAGAFLFSKTLWNLRQQNLGLRTENVVTFVIQPDLNGYDNQRTISFIGQLRSRLLNIPGVQAVSTSEMPTLTGSDMGGNITVEGSQATSDDDQHAEFDSVSPGYFSSLGIPLLSGREFSDADSSTANKVAVISETAANHFLPGRNPIGVHFAFGGGKDVKPDIEIVGVVRDVKQTHVRDAQKPYIYVPYTQHQKIMEMAFYVRAQQDPLLISSAVRDEVGQLDPNLPVFDLKTFQRVVDEDLFAERMVAALSLSFGSLAALLAALGIYGVLAYLVVQRTREIGIRMALGAVARDVRVLVVREVGTMVLLGVALGLPAAYGLARLGESILFGVHAGDPLTYAAAVALIAVIAAAACYIPARRATRVDPLVALRYE